MKQNPHVYVKNSGGFCKTLNFLLILKFPGPWKTYVEETHPK